MQEEAGQTRGGACLASGTLLKTSRFSQTELEHKQVKTKTSPAIRKQELHVIVESVGARRGGLRHTVA